MLFYASVEINLHKCTEIESWSQDPRSGQFLAKRSRSRICPLRSVFFGSLLYEKKSSHDYPSPKALTKKNNFGTPNLWQHFPYEICEHFMYRKHFVCVVFQFNSFRFPTVKLKYFKPKKHFKSTILPVNFRV